MMETNWIRFDPDDELTWPEMETEYYSKTVLACSDDRIYVAYIDMSEYNWSLTNEAEDVMVPIDCVAAWMPLPEPYDRSRKEPMGTWLFNAGDYTCSECGETFSDELFYISRSREPGLPGHCPGCGFPMKTKEAKQ